MTLTQYLLQLPEPLFGTGQDGNNEVVGDDRLPEISEEVLGEIEARLQLSFVPSNGSGNLCYLQNKEVQPAFRTSFQYLHLLDVIYACTLSLDAPTPNLDILPFPTNTDNFWELSEYGKKLRLLHTLNFPLPHSVFPFVANSDAEQKVTGIASEYPSFKQDTKKGTGKIWLNTQHYFADAPKEIWDFRIHQRYPAREALRLLQKPPLPPNNNKVLDYQHRLYALEQSLPLQKAIRALGLGKPLL